MPNQVKSFLTFLLSAFILCSNISSQPQTPWGDFVIRKVEKKLDTSVKRVAVNDQYDFLELSYDAIHPFSNDRALVVWNESEQYFPKVGKTGDIIKKYGYIDKTGSLVIPLEYDTASSFSDGYAVVAKATEYIEDYYVTEHETGIIDPNGNYVQELSTSFRGHSFKDGVMLAQFKDKSGNWNAYFINTSGEKISKELSNFSFACGVSEGVIVASPDNKNWGVMNTKGAWVSKPGSVPNDAYDIRSFTDGLARVKTSNYRFTYIDSTGKLAFPKGFHLTYGFSDGYAATGKLVDGPGYKIMYGYINKEGEWAIPPIYELVGNFSDGLAFVVKHTETKNHAYGFIDKAGDTVIRFEYDAAGDFSEGVAAVNKDGKLGYIDKKGNWVIEPQFIGNDYENNRHTFYNGMAMVYTTERKKGYIAKRDQNSPIRIKIDDNYLPIDICPEFSNNVMMVPLRKVSEALGFSVSWNNDTKTAIIENESSVITLPLGKKEILVNGKTQRLCHSVESKNGNLFVPLEVFDKYLNYTIKWDMEFANLFINR